MLVPRWKLISPRLGKALAASLMAAAVPTSVLVAGIAGAAPHQGPQPGDTSKGAYQLTTIFSGATLGVTQPDDLTTMDGQLFVAFQNGVGPQGQANPKTGGTTSTVVEMSQTGVIEGKWTLAGHVDGLTADPQMHQVIATSNEDANSSLFTIDPSSSTPVLYTYSPSPLPHNGGTDAISIVAGQILVSASAPGTTGAPAPQPSYPAVYSVQLDPSTHVATVTSLFSDEATATVANVGPTAGKTVQLGLTDPDSNEVVPPQSPRFGGDFVLDSQGDKQQVYVSSPGRPNQHLTVLNLSQSINDSAWVTSGNGSLFITDHTNDLVDVLRGDLAPGTVYVATTPCDANDAPTVCPTTGYPANYLGTLNLTNGTVGPVDLNGQMVQPGGLLFVGGPGQAQSTGEGFGNGGSGPGVDGQSSNQ